MHIVSTLANHEFLNMERVLDYPVYDVFSYMQYSDAKARAENANFKFQQDMRERTRRR